jgi:large subunit ribosomal protein L18
MSHKNNCLDRRTRVHLGIRRRVHGTSNRPRLSVYKSNRYVYTQIIDDNKGITLVEASSVSFGKNNVTLDCSKRVGEILAERALDKGIDSVVFDRSGYKYHGNVKVLADAARAKGLKF